MRVKVILFALFWLITFSLGYPTLARYSPSKTPGLTDARSYGSMVEGRAAGLGHHQFRILVPYIARPIEKLARGRLGSWDSVSFALLAANGFFVAWAAILFVSIGTKVVGDPGVGLSAALLFLLSFNVSNLMLAGLVDSVESWAMLAATWALLNQRWKVLPLIGAFAALGKETSVMLLIPFCVAWYITSARDNRNPRAFAVSIVAMVVAQAGTLLLLGALLDAHFLRVQGFTESRGVLWFAKSALSLFDQQMVYAFAWIVPLGALRIRAMPRPWIIASFATLVVTLTVGIFSGGVTRPAFNAFAPVFLLSTALFLSHAVRAGTRLLAVESHEGS